MIIIPSIEGNLLSCAKKGKNTVKVPRHFRQAIFLDRNGDPIAAAQRDFMTMTKTCLLSLENQRLVFQRVFTKDLFFGRESYKSKKWGYYFNSH